jgi:hypothetical protein
MSRWSDYVHVRDEEVAEMWAEAARGRRSVYILGEGFDPRMPLGISRAVESGVFDELSVLSLGLAPPGGTSERALRAQENVERLGEIVAGAGLAHERIPYPNVEQRRALARLLLGAVLKNDLFRRADHVVIDISALPVGVYFGLIKGLLNMSDKGELAAELQICVAENVEIDRRIAGRGGVATPAPMLGFSFGIELDPDAQRPLLVWAPLLGEGAAPQMEALAERLQPDEICPVLPFPARNPRRADDLLLEMRGLLVDRLGVEPSNYIYADERNPFDLYRALTRLQDRYRSALQPVGETSVVLSLHSSKSLSLGALLAAYEHELPAFNAEPDHYGFTGEDRAGELSAQSELSGVWLVGTPTG